MTSRSKANARTASSTSDRSEAAQDTVKDETPPLCGTVHTLPVLTNVTCQRPADHSDEQPEGPDQDKHRAKIGSALYVW